MKFIATADFHLRKNVPICRKETEMEFFDFQFNVVNQIMEISKQNNKIPLFIAGDIFDKSFPGMNILNQLLDTLDFNNIEICAGNHEVPYHQNELLINSAYYTLRNRIESNNSKIGYRDFSSDNYTELEIMLCHHLCFRDEKSIPPNIDAITADQLLDMYPKAKIIVCGDNHQGFIYKKNNRMVIVPGCIIIQNVAEFDYTPAVYIVDSEKLSTEKILLNNPVSMLTANHIVKQNERNERIGDFINKLNNKKLNSFDFIGNLRAATQEKNIEEAVKLIILNIIEDLYK